MIKSVAACAIVAALGAAQPSLPPDHPSAIGHKFLAALKASSFDELQPLAAPSTVDWFRRNFPVLSDYKIVREQFCAETVEISTVRSDIVPLLATSTTPETWMPVFSRLETTHPCLARVVLSHALSEEMVAKLDGKVSFGNHELIVDVVRPGLGGQQTDRGALRVVNVQSTSLSTGWKVDRFDPFYP